MRIRKGTGALRRTMHIAALATAVDAGATHISGGEIYWNCLGGNQYEITLVVYRDCAGINLDPSYVLPVTSPCGSTSMVVSTPGGTEISQLCDLELPNSTCSGGTLPGTEQYIYTGTVTLPPCNYWTISWTENWRNNAIANLQAPGTQLMYIEATLNNVVAPCEDSPQFTNLAIPYVCTGFPISYSYGAYDVEGDSMVYSLIGARTTNGNPIPYVAPHTPSQPIPGITLDPQTGLLSFTLSAAGNWVVVVRVTIYDANGNLIGTIMRDMQFVAYPCTNQPPDPTTGTIANPSGSGVQTAPYALEVCESGQFCFDMVISDPNTNNVLNAMSNVAAALPGATFSFSGTNPITCNVCWTATAGSSGFYPFIVTVDDGACPIPAFQTYVYGITVINGLFANVQVVDESCAGMGNGSASVSVTNGNAPFQYVWSTGATGTAITAGAGSYSVTVSDANGCTSAPLPAVINAAAQPATANAGPDQVNCLGDLPVDLAGSVVNAPNGTWSGGSGSFTGSWPTIDYTPTAAELATGGVNLILYASNPGCPPDQDTVFIALSDGFPGATLSGTDATCNGANDGSATYTPNDPGNTYLWSFSGQTTPTVTGLATGTYSLQVIDVVGCDTTLNVTIGALAAISITGFNVVDEDCAGNNNGSITVSVGGGTPPYQYTWSNGATTSTIIAGAGTYSVSITDANGCAPAVGSATINTSAQAATANAGPDQLVCMNAIASLTGSGTNATTGTWSGGGGGFTGTGWNVYYQPTTSEFLAGGVDLYLSVSGTAGCPPDVDTVHLTLSNSFMNAAISGTSPGCAGASSGAASFTPNNPSFTYAWNTVPAQNSATATGLDAGTYSVTVTDGSGCDTTMSVVVNDPPQLAISALGSTDATCNGGNNGTASITVIGGTGGYTYTWSANASGQTTPSIVNLGAGLYSVNVNDANGCSVNANVMVNDPPPVSLTAQVPDTVCVNAPVQLTAQAGGGTAPYTIGWVGIGFGDTVNYAFSASQTMSVTVVDANGCAGPTINEQVIVLNLNTAAFSAYGDTTVCPGGYATFGATLSGYAGSAQITWPSLGLFGPGPHVLGVTATQTIQAIVTDGCGNTLTDQILVQLETAPAIALPNLIAEGCEPLEVTMPVLNPGLPVTWLWDFGDGTTSTAATPTHTYNEGTFLVQVTIATPAGCTSTSNTGQVIAHPTPIAEFTASPWTADASAATIDFTDLSTGSINTYDWDFGDGDAGSAQNPSHTYGAPGTYPVTLTVTNLYGCTDAVMHPVTITPVYDITIPNAFTPDPNGGNGGAYDPSDLSNNIFYPFIKYVKDFKMRIYDRWGELVFESTDITVGWDGYYRGELSQQDVYAVQVWVRFIDDREVERLGDLTLIR